MNAREALGRLRALKVPAATTSEAAAVLGLTIEAASQTLRRLAAAGLVQGVRKGLWALGESSSALALAEYVTAPYPSYVSLQTALYRRGLVEQIPSMVFLVSVGRPARVATSLGTYSVHHVDPSLFGGFDVDAAGVKMATAEKALVDFLYLSPARSGLFAALPELELPRDFRWPLAREWSARIPSARGRTIVDRRLAELQAGARRAASGRALPTRLPSAVRP